LIAIFANLAGRGLHVEGFECRHHVVGRNSIRAHLVWLEPDPHRVFLGAQDVRVANSVDALELRQNVDVGEVVEELLVVVGVGTEDAQVHEHRVLFLGNLDAVAYHLRRQLAHDGVDTVLHVDGRDVRVRPCLEQDLDDADAVIARVRAHVLHPRYPVDGPLEWNDGSAGYRFSVGPRIFYGDGHFGRCDAREQLHRQTTERDQTLQRNDD